ncbi:MAG TPA: hypothetical protein EYG11_19910 [Candidatus Latescibacteria bacterium]|nr:hypothetical protein [Candidatus Handelsmanbacteria bacterium]HIL10968.1 hypothetical protein [Candidatus Latescibacterota bacterium]
MPCAFEHPTANNEDCTFAVAEGDLVALAGQTWCIYHLPMSGRDGTPSPKADYGAAPIAGFNAKIFALIDESASESGHDTLDLSGVVFPGPINFTGRTMPAVLFSHAYFHGGAYFSDAQFLGAASFAAAHFADLAYFSEASFVGEVDFTDTRFGGVTSFVHAHFVQHARFAGAQFADVASFSEARFAGIVDLAGVRSVDDISFTEVRFGGRASFANVHFGEDAFFEHARFGAEAFFPNAYFGRDAVFANTQFSAYADFTDACYYGNADFSVTPFDRSAQPPMENCAFQRVSFVGAAFGRMTTFSHRPFQAASDFTRSAFVVAPVLQGCTFYEAIALPEGAA